MPFTFAHPAAILPFAGRAPALPTAALVAGSMAPDFEYLLRLRPYGSFAHSGVGLLVVGMPVAVLIYIAIRRLLLPALAFAFGCSYSPQRPQVLGFVAALSLGLLSHVGWDSFTHASGLAVRQWPILSTDVVGVPAYKLAQHASSALGSAAIALVTWHHHGALVLAHPRRVLGLVGLVGIPALVLGALNSVRASSIQEAAGYFAVGAIDGAILAALIAAALYHLPKREKAA